MNKAKFPCLHCGKEFDTSKQRNRHQQAHDKSHTCIVCGKHFGRADSLKKHLNLYHAATQTYTSPPASPMTSTSTQDLYEGRGKRKVTVHGPPRKRKKVSVQYDCTVCGAQFQSIILLNEHFRTHVEDLVLNDRLPLYEQALNNALKVVTFFAYGEQKTALMTFFAEKKSEILQYLMDSDGLDTTGVRWYMCVGIQYYQTEKDRTDNCVAYHNSLATIRLRGEDEDTVIHTIDEAFNHMDAKKEQFQRNGSKWQFQEVLHVRLYMGKYRPLRGSAYIQLPKEISSNRAILNIQNQDDKCFLWSILAHLHEVPENNHGYRVTKYMPYQHELNMKDISYPVPLVDIPRFEKQNNISVNVIGYDSAYYPLYISKQQRQVHVNLLLVEKGGNTHYCLIKNFDGMLHSQSKHNGRKYFCTYCLHGFIRQDLLEKHRPYCQVHGMQHTELPSESEKIMKFKNIAKMLKVPFVIYADFECLLKPTGLEGKKHHHVPCGYSYLIVSTVPDYHFEAVTYSGPQVMDHFFEHILEDGDYLLNCLNNKKPIMMTDQDEDHFRMTASCHICKKAVAPSDKVRDHCHLTGKYRGPAHNQCNLAYKLATIIPVFYHNLEGYDSHLLMQDLGKYKHRKLSCISKNMEKYISFTLGPLRFLDSLSFMNQGLASLVSNLTAGADPQDTHFHQIKRHFPDPKQRELLLRKGVYPYEWMDDESKMDHPSLPDIDAFYSCLYLQGITKEDYAHAQKVWDTFEMKTMRDYHDLYLKSDVLLLADVFENFREQCLSCYGLDPAHYYTAPGLSWDAALKMTSVELELLTDIDMHLMIEKGVRGGVSTITTKYAKANNPLVEGYDESKPYNYMLDLDANNLYGWAMSQPLPTHDFKWMSQEEIQKLTQVITQVPADAPTGYILEVDLNIPVELHDYFNHYVPAPEHMQVTEDMLSPFNKVSQEKLGVKHTPCTKLIPNLFNKEKYVIHYRTLQCYLQLGLKMGKVHRVIQFQQRAWLKEYIGKNTEMRQAAKNTFEKNFFKLMNNSVFGKVSILFFINILDVFFVSGEPIDSVPDILFSR